MAIRKDINQASVPTFIPPSSPSFTVPAGFEIITEQPKRCVCVAYGKTGSGKTHFALSQSPGPVYTLNYDDRDRSTILQCQGPPFNQLIARAHIPFAVHDKMPDALIKSEASRAVSETQRILDIACLEAEKGNCQTIVFDTGTEFTDPAWLSLVGTLADVKDPYGKLSGALKSMVRRMIHQCRNAGAHVIILAREKEIWKPGKANEGGGPTGVFVPRINDAFLESSDFVIEVREHKRARFDEPLTWEISVQNAKVRKGEQGRVYHQAEWEGLGAFKYAAIMQGYNV
jgi:hypothetical protein